MGEILLRILSLGLLIYLLRSNRRKIMASVKEILDAAVTDLKAEFDAAIGRVAADVQHLKDLLAAGAITPADLDAVLANIKVVSDGLKAEDPDPSFPPVV